MVTFDEAPPGGVMTFYPNWEEFQDFTGYIKMMEGKGAHHFGIAKVCPISSSTLLHFFSPKRCQFHVFIVV